MLISPKVAIANGWVSGITDINSQLQPNAIDFTVDKLFHICPPENSPIIITNDKKLNVLPTNRALLSDAQNYWLLDYVGSYDLMSNVYLELPPGVIAKLIVRSTFNRSGMFLTAGIYDSGYVGHVGCVLHHPLAINTAIAVGTRIGQVEFWQAEVSGDLYSGGYNHSKGTHWNGASK